MYMFGLGAGEIKPAKLIEQIERETGADYITHTDPGCSCGYGCSSDCEANTRHWWSVQNHGEPHNSHTSDRVRELLISGHASVVYRGVRSDFTDAD
jgi:hypothetical protein